MSKNGKYIVISLLLSVIIIFFQFNQIPLQMAPDEVEFTQLALSLDEKPYQTYSPIATGHATLYFYIILASFKLFGVSLLALRLPAAIFGVINSILIYLIFDRIFKNKHILAIPLSFVLTLAFITLRWHINFSRFSFEATFLLFLELVSTLFIFLYFENKKMRWLVGSSIFAGLTFNSYTPGRVFFIIPLLLLLNIAKKAKIQRRVLNLTIYIIPFLVFAAPLILTVFETHDYRVNEEFIFNAKDLTSLQKYQGVISNLASNTGMLFFKGDMNGRHNYPGKAALNPILFFFFLVGTWHFIKKRKQWYDYYFLLYFTVSFIPTIFSHPHGNPNMLRTFTVLPGIIYFIALGMEYFATLEVKKYKKYVTFAILILIVLSSLYELRTYFVHQKREMQYTFEIRKSFDWLKKRNFILTPEAYQY